MRDYTQEHIAKNPTMKLQEKFNLNLNLNADFHLPVGSGWQADPRIQGQYCYYRANLPSEFAYFYAPTNPFNSYLKVKRGGRPVLIPVVYNTFYDMNFFDGLVIASRMNGNYDYNYQFFLSNLDTINIIDEYREENFIVTAGTTKSIFLPFPTYNLKVMIKGSVSGGGTNTFNFNIPVEFFQASHGFYTIENKDLTPNPTFIINNYYEFNDAGGTEMIPDTTNPKMTFPSWKTTINLDLNAGSDLINCYLIAYSYLKIGGF